MNKILAPLFCVLRYQDVFLVKIFLQVLLTTRNIFIAILALSDLLLCAFTMPLTLMDIITKYWAFGEDLVSQVGSNSGFN